MSRWYCENCAPKSTATQPNPCPACCGFTSLDDELRGRIGGAVVALAEYPIFDIARHISPDLAAAISFLEDVAAGEAS